MGDKSPKDKNKKKPKAVKGAAARPSALPAPRKPAR